MGWGRRARGGSDELVSRTVGGRGRRPFDGLPTAPAAAPALDDPVDLLADVADREALGGPAWFDRTVAREVVDGLYPLYREPPRHALWAHAADGPA